MTVREASGHVEAVDSGRRAPRVAVVGGGVSGLTAAYRLRRRLGPEAGITLFERADRLGGKVHTAELAGCPLDVGAEAFLVRREEVTRLAAEVGLADSVVHPGPASAVIRAGGSARSLPTGTFMGVPSSAESVRSVLSEDGLAAVRREPSMSPVELDAEDVSVGALLRERVGDEVVERLVEPLLGGVYAGTADGLGLRATMPALAAALDRGAGSVLAAAESLLPPPAAPGRAKPPVFGAFEGGYRALVDRLATLADARTRFGTTVRSVDRTTTGWRLELGSAVAPESVDVDAVVVAAPPPAARRMLAGSVPDAATGFASVELASSVVVAMALPADAELPDASGVLLARGERRGDGTPFTAKAFTFSSRKWPHLRGSDGELLVRASVGRFADGDELRTTDDELLARVRADLAELTGVRAAPVDSRVVRWGGGLPQYGVGHLDTVAAIRRAVAETPGLAVAGAALDGVGVPACVGTGEAAADEIGSHLRQR